MPHVTFQEQLRAELLSCYPNPAEGLLPWAADIRTVWFANLDFADALLTATYSDVGRPVVYGPKNLLRCLLLCQQSACRSLTVWVAQLRRAPILCTLCGFPAGRVPSVGTLYDFLDRLYPRPRALRARGIRRPHRRIPKPKRGNKLPANRKKLARLAGWLTAHIQQPPAPHPADLWDHLLTATVDQSIRRQILPTPDSLHAAADGSLLRSGAHSYGRKTCQCPRGCTCDRYFSDPTARVGFDSTNNCFVLGYSAYILSDTDSGHHLPLALSLAPANRHDGVALLGLLSTARRLLPLVGSAVTTVSADSVHDHDAIYDFCVDLGVNPLIDRKGKLPAPSPHLRDRLDQAGLSLSPQGRPRCPHGFLHSSGYSRPGIRQFQCPRRDPEGCPCTDCPLRDGRRFTLDISDQPRLLAPNPQTEPAARKAYKKRTNAERTFSLLTSSSGLDIARHRRAYVWHGRLALTAILSHIRVWARTTTAAADDWLRSWSLS